MIQVSVIILNYNTFDLTRKCIASIYDRTKGVSFEIILVDNDSKECNPDLFLKIFSKIKLIKSLDNLGFAKGNNLGIKEASGEVILLLNSDTELVNDAISLCYEKLLAEDEIGVITAKLLFPNGEIQKQCRRFDAISLLLTEQLRIHKLWSKEKRARVLLNGYFDHETEVYSERVWGTFFMFKKEILQHFPGKKLADRFFMYGEDNEWCYQLRKFTKLKILYFPSAVVEHVMGGSRFEKTISKEKLGIIERHKIIVLKDYYGRIKSKIYLLLKWIL